MKEKIPTKKPEYLPKVLWDFFLEAVEVNDQTSSDVAEKNPVPIDYLFIILLGCHSEEMFKSMQSRNGGIAKGWDDSTWITWLQGIAVTIKRCREKSRKEIIRKRKELLTKISETSLILAELMREAQRLFYVDGIEIPLRAIGIDSEAPPAKHYLLSEIEEIAFDIRDDLALPSPDWIDRNDRILARISNYEPRLQFSLMYTEYAKARKFKISDTILAYMCSMVYGLSDSSGDEFSKLKSSINKARKAHEKKREKWDYYYVYSRPSCDDSLISAYAPHSGNAVLSYMIMAKSKKRANQ